MNAEKDHLRASIKERLSRMGEGEYQAESRSLCRRILELLPTPITVTAFYPMPTLTEPNIRPLLEELMERGDKVYLPRFNKGKMTYNLLENFEDLATGDLRVQEPPIHAPELDPGALQYALIPGMAFDRNGNRLGRGNGGFDMWIAKQKKKNPDTRYWAVGFENQVVHVVPVEHHDEKIDGIVTARGFIDCNL